MKLIRLALLFVMSTTLVSADHYHADSAAASSTFCTTRAPITQFPDYVYAVAHPGLWVADSHYWYESYAKAFVFLSSMGLDVVSNHHLLDPYIDHLVEGYLFQEESENEQAYYELIERLIMEHALPQIEEKYLGKDLKTLDQSQWLKMIIDIQAQFIPYFINPDYQPGYRKADLLVFKLVMNLEKFPAYLEKHRPELVPAWWTIRTKWRKLLGDETFASLTPLEQQLLDEYLYFPPGWPHIPAKMRVFATKLVRLLQEGHDPIETAAYAHMEFVKIHPFEDANGRTARVIMNMILMQAGYQPVVFLRESTYAEAVTQDAKVPGTFACYLRKKVMEIDELPVEANPYTTMAELEKDPETVSTVLKDRFKEHSQDSNDHLCEPEEPALNTVELRL